MKDPQPRVLVKGIAKMIFKIMIQYTSNNWNPEYKKPLLNGTVFLFPSKF